MERSDSPQPSADDQDERVAESKNPAPGKKEEADDSVKRASSTGKLEKYLCCQRVFPTSRGLPAATIGCLRW